MPEEIMQEEQITRAGTSTSTSNKKTSSTTAKKKTTSSSSKKTGTSTTARKKTTTTAKKKTGTTTAKKPASSSTTLKLSAKEKKLVQNYRKCNALEKQLIDVVTEKAAGGLNLSFLSTLLKD